MKNQQRATCRLITLSAMGMWCSCADLHAAAADSIDFGDPATLNGRGLRTTGEVVEAKIKTDFGTLKTEYPVRVLRSERAALSFALKLDGGADQPIILEIEEIHNRRDETLAYLVMVGGRPVYFRTYQEIGSGPNVYYVQAPAVADAEGKVTVTLRNVGGGEVSLSRIWAYADFWQLAEADDTYQKMPYLQAPFISLGQKGKRFGWSEQQSGWKARDDGPLWQRVRERQQGTPFTHGLHMGVSYPQVTHTARDALEEVGKYLDISVENGAAMQCLFSGGDWGGHPTGPDGLGGYFSDVQYSQAAYHIGQKRYSATWPGTPGNAIWGTRNGGTIREFLRERIKIAGDTIATRTAFLRAKGIEVPPFYFVLDQGPGTWRNCDYGPGIVGDAARDGVKLDPTDGLCHEEKDWIFRNLAAATDSQARGISEGIGRNHVVVKGAQVTLPEEQHADNVYGHPFNDPTYPFYDHRWAGYHWGIGEDLWTSGETLEKLPAEYYDYSRLSASSRASTSNAASPTSTTSARCTSAASSMWSSTTVLAATSTCCWRRTTASTAAPPCRRAVATGACSMSTMPSMAARPRPSTSCAATTSA